jgi:hypothetical protein
VIVDEDDGDGLARSGHGLHDEGRPERRPRNIFPGGPGRPPGAAGDRTDPAGTAPATCSTHRHRRVPLPSGVIVVNFSKLNKAGLVLAFVLGLLDMASPFGPAPEGAEAGPPAAILWLDAVLGLITVIAVVVAWRSGRRGAVRIAAGARIISMITALPAFFVDVPAVVQAFVGVFVVLTLACVAMMLAPSRQPVAVTD